MRATPILLACIAIALFAVAIASADAQTRRSHRPTPIHVVLQPFTEVRAAIHEIADPIVERAHRSRPAEPVYEPAEPVRVAYVTTTRRAEPAPPVPRPAADDEEDEDSAEPEAPVRTATREFESSASKPIVAGRRAVLRNGVAYAPSHAPQSVKNAIWAANSLRRKPYVWGGGHGSFHDRGYDCSGTVSFALHNAGALSSPLPSTDFMRFGERGRGRWITIYSRRGHTFAMIAGLRLDTTDFRNGGNTGPRWHADGRDTRGFVARHPSGM
jgi:cell wall-associated NlpC family hydrolase